MWPYRLYPSTRRFSPSKGHVHPLFCTLLALILAAAAIPGRAQAQETRPPELSAESLIETARTALLQGNLDDAEFLLDGVKSGEGDTDDIDFLYGSIAMARGEWETAIARFRAMLARNPDLPRVRLDLALAYFQARQDTSAAYHFRQALGDEDLPLVARAKALAFLDAIRRRKSWSVNAAVAIAPDSNINAATSSRFVDLFGFPATLSEDARKTSGVGLSADISGGYEARISPDLRFRANAGLYTRTYKQSEYNDRTATMRAGPRFLFEDFDVRAEATGRVRVLGGDTYSRAAGLRLSSDWLVAPAWRVRTSASAEQIWYETFLGDGRAYGAQLGLSHAFGRSTLLHGDAAFRREEIDSQTNSWKEFAIAFAVAREFPLGFVVSVGPSHRWRWYDEPALVLGPDPRKDRTLAGRVKVSNRHIELFGFMPEITLRHERRSSNLDLYDYTRNVAEIGVVRAF